MEKEINNLMNLSKKIGSYPEFAQGGGGNISVKINQNLMAIKASGYLLKDVKNNDGFSFVNHQNIANYLKNKASPKTTEQDFDSFIVSNKIHLDGYPNLKPSIETGFHSILPQKYIIHTHSVYVNILCCSKEGRDIVKKLFPNAFWVQYANPGKEITLEITGSIDNISSDLYFMQNHGIIVCSETAEDAYNLHKFVNDKIIGYFNIDNGYNFKDNYNYDFKNYNKDAVLFPDQVIYLMSENLQKTNAGTETLYAYNYILNNIKNLNLTANFISKKDINYIENMESEKYRKNLIANPTI